MLRVCRQFPLALALALALAALLLGGCVRRDSNVQIAEADEPLFREAKSLVKQGRETEALNVFLKLIDARGLRSTPESHLEVAEIYLKHIQNPIRAMFHYETYIELMPNSKERPLVQDRLIAAKREFARRLPARPLDDQSVRLETTAELETLRRENDELRAELATLKGGGAALANRGPRAFAPVRGVTGAPGITFTAAPSAEADTATQRTAQTAPANPPSVFTPAPAPAQPPPVQPAATPQRSTAKQPAGAPSSSGRTHTVAQSDSLWGIARKYYRNPTGAQVRGIYEANRNVMRSETDLRPGMTLKIP